MTTIRLVCLRRPSYSACDYPTFTRFMADDAHDALVPTTTLAIAIPPTFALTSANRRIGLVPVVVLALVVAEVGSRRVA